MKSFLQLCFILTIAVSSTFAQGEFGSSMPLPADSMSARADSMLRKAIWKPFDRSTIVVQAVVGGALSAAVIIPSVDKLKGSEGLGEAFMLIGGSLIAEGVISLGIHFTGELMGGDGSYGGTFLGSLAGGGVALLPAIISGRGNGEEVFPPAIIGAAVGAVLGYHLFASPVYESGGSQSINKPGMPAGNIQVTVVSIRF